MCPSFIGILDIQSWWEVPSIAHFCSLFRAAFNLLDFDIEELEEALLTDGTEECASSLLTELIVRLLRGCLGNNDITASNYQMFLRRLFRQKYQETGHSNIFNADIDFQFLPLRRKVQILQALCNFRLGADDVFDSLKNLEAESLRVEPLGWDDNTSAYWYFYGTRLYREDYIIKPKGKKRKSREERKSKKNGDCMEEKTDRVWQVVCFTEADWIHLTEKFKESTSRVEKDLYLSLSENFLPEIPRLFQEKERLRRKRLLESLPRRTSSRVQTKNKQKEEDEQKQEEDSYKDDSSEKRSKRELDFSERENRAKQRELKRSQSRSSQSGKSRSPSQDTVRIEKFKKKTSRHHSHHKTSERNDQVDQARPSGRQTNNSLACATGQILIPEQKEHPNRKKLKTSQIFGLMEEDVQTDMYKVLDQLKAHEDAWPFMDPVEEDYAPNYYSVIRRPMDLQRMEDRLDQGYYTDFSMFQSDFNLIVKNCRLYNGQDNEYTEMVDNLEAAFNRLTQRYFECLSSSDDEIAIEYPFQNPTPKKPIEKPVYSKKPENVPISQKRKRVLSSDDERSSKESLKKDEKRLKVDKKKTKHFEGESDQSNSSLSEFSKSILKKKKKKFKNTKKKHKDKHSSKRNKDKKKHSRHLKKIKKSKKLRRSSIDSHNASEAGTSQCEVKEPNQWDTSSDAIFYKDKYDKIKERRRGSFKAVTYSDSISESSKTSDKKQNTLLSDKNKNSKLKETIEKLKAKSEKSTDDPNLFDGYFKSNISPQKSKNDDIKCKTSKSSESRSKAKMDEYEFTDDFENNSETKTDNKINKKVIKNKFHSSVNNKNESASEALEQAAKDICKLFDEPSKNSEYGSNSNSPSQISDDYLRYTSKLDDDSSLHHIERDKSTHERKGIKKRINKDLVSKIVSRKKEVQRTIERLQPGKTKGNLISNIQSALKQEDLVSLSNASKIKEVKVALQAKMEDSESPKLSLGTVLDSVGFGIEKQHNFNESLVDSAAKVQVADMGTMTNEVDVKEVPKESIVKKNEPVDVKKSETENKKNVSVSNAQEKATPNLSAWFKAFGAPKSGTSKKKAEESSDQDDSKSNDTHIETKNSTVETVKNDVTHNEESPPEGGESPLPNVAVGGRVRRTSTGSSVSERSSFSQDLDSPRHQPSHTSPLIRSPASPRIDEHQKNLYPPMNGTVRVGFYQDTASVKSSPEKSCSPREAPQSPYAAYSQHVYALSSNAAQQTNQSNNLGENMSKSPLTGFGQSYYESSKTTQKRAQDDYSVFGSDSIYKPPVSPTATSFSPVHSSFPQHSQHSPYSHIQHSPQTFSQVATGNTLSQPYDTKTVEKSVFPVKKRTYSESQHLTNTSENLTVSQNNQVPANKLDLSMINNLPLSTPNTNFMHSSASVITSTNLNNTQKIQYSACASNADLHLQTNYDQHKPVTRDNYSDSNSTQQAMLKKPYDFSTMNRVNKTPFIENISNTPKESQNSGLDLKNNAYNTKNDTNKSDSRISMDYTNKMPENQPKTCNENINMGYIVPDMSTENKMGAPINTKNDSLLNKSHRNYDLYSMVANQSYPGMMDLNSVQSGSKSSIVQESADCNQGYHLDKFNPNMHYQSLPLDTTKRNTEDMINDGYKKRADILSKSSYGDSVNLSTMDNYTKNLAMSHQSVNDWKMDSGNKTSDQASFANYRHLGESESMLHTKKSNTDMAPTYDNSNISPICEPTDSLQKLQPELRLPLCSVLDMPAHKSDHQQVSQVDYSTRTKNVMSLHGNKQGEGIFGHNSQLNAGINAYKAPNCHSPISMDQSSRNLSTLPQMMDRFKELSNFQSSQLSYEKSIPLAHLYPKNVHNNLHNANNSGQIFPTSLPMAYNRDPLYLSNMPPNVHNLSSMEPMVPEVDKKSRTRKKKNTSETTPTASTAGQTFHSYSGLKSAQSKTDASNLQLKSSNIVPGSAFNFGSSGGVGLPTGLYGDSSNFLELRNSSMNPYMAANYMTPPSTVRQRTTPDNPDKNQKNESVNLAANPYRFLSHPQGRPGYSFLGIGPSPTLYPQLIQRQDELFRHPGTQMMGIFPGAYPDALGVRQPYDAINRNTWL